MDNCPAICAGSAMFSLREILDYQWSNRHSQNEWTYRYSPYVVRSKEVTRA